MGMRNSSTGLLVKHLKRLGDPKDTVAAWSFAGVLLVGEALLCALIIWKVPCEYGQLADGATLLGHGFLRPPLPACWPVQIPR